MSSDLIVELITVGASLLPSMQAEALVGLKQVPVFSSFGVVHLWILLCLSKFAHRRPRQFQLPGNGTLREPLFHKGAHVLIARGAFVSSDLLLQFVVAHPERPLVGGRGASSLVFLWF